MKINQKIITECINFLSNIDTKEFFIAFSGGSDSSVLLHAMHNLIKSQNIQIRTIYINHHFHAEADLCAKHCLSVAQSLGIEHITADVFLENKSNIEQELREKRYKVIKSFSKSNECILTAHHLDDQIETFFLRLMRGSGPRGLSCMKQENFLFDKKIGRPLLKVEKSEICSYIKNNSIKIFEDKTNNLLKFDRNFVRSKIVPLLKSRWPSMSKVMKENINKQEISFSIISNYILKILKECYVGGSDKLLIKKIQEEEYYMQCSLIHEWVNNNTSILLDSHQISEIVNNIVNAKNDSTPLFSFHNFNIRKYQGILFLIKTPLNMENESFKVWNLENDLKFNNLTLKISKLKELGVYEYLLTNKPVIVKKREGGEKIKLNVKFHQKLKKVFQSRNIPIWEREAFALIFVGEQLIAAYGPNDIIISNTKY